MTTVQVSPQRLLLSGWLFTNLQVNITTATYDTGHTLIYITLLLLFMLFFVLLPFFWAGWLSSVPLVRYSLGGSSLTFFHFKDYFDLLPYLLYKKKVKLKQLYLPPTPTPAPHPSYLYFTPDHTYSPISDLGGEGAAQ
jgi:hypothetical protein